MDKNKLIDLIKQQAESLGRPPTMREFPYDYQIKKHFGTWNRALEEAGLLPHRKFYTDQELLDMIKDKALELGKIPAKRDLKEYQTIAARFGTWKNALLFAGLKEQKVDKNFPSKADLRDKKRQERMKRTLANLKEYAQFHGFPHRKEWDNFAREHDLYISDSILLNLQISWEELRQRLQVLPKQKTYSVEECLEFLILAGQELGKAFSKREYNDWAKQNRYPSSNVVARRFKTFNQAKEAAGLLLNEGKGLIWTDQELRQILQSCYVYYNRKYSEEEYETWRQLQNKEVPNIETIRQRLGSIPELKKSMKIETYLHGNRYTGNEWEQSLYKFIQQQLSFHAYEEWASQNQEVQVNSLHKYAGGYQEALKQVLKDYIKRLD